jgi:AcrR family transcriptional regulator
MLTVHTPRRLAQELAMPKLIDTEALFRVTVDLFAERGFDGLTTQEVATRAGINEVTIYRRFGTKAALVEAAIANRLASVPFAELTVTDDVEADLVAMAEAFRATTAMFGGAVITLITEASRHPELRSAMAPLLTNMGGAVRVLQAHQQRGTLAPGDPWQRLVLLMSPFVAGGMWARSGVAPPAELDPAGVVAAFLDGNRASRTAPQGGR